MSCNVQLVGGVGMLYGMCQWFGVGMRVMRDIYLAVAWNPSRYIMVTEGLVWEERFLPSRPIVQRFALNRDCIGEVRDCFPAMGNSCLYRPCVYRWDVIHRRSHRGCCFITVATECVKDRTSSFDALSRILGSY